MCSCNGKETNQALQNHKHESHDNFHSYEVLTAVIDTLEDSNEDFVKVDLIDNDKSLTTSSLFFKSEFDQREPIIIGVAMDVNTKNIIGDTIRYYLTNYITKIKNKDTTIQIGRIINPFYGKFIKNSSYTIFNAGDKGCYNNATTKESDFVIFNKDGISNMYYKMKMVIHMGVPPHPIKDVYFKVNEEIKTELKKYKYENNRMNIGIEVDPVEIQFDEGLKFVVSNITIITENDF